MPKLDKIKELKHIRKRWKIIALVSLLLLILDVSLFYGIQHYYPDAWDKPKETITTKVQASDEKDTLIKSLKSVDLNSPYALVIDMEDNQTIYEKKADERIYPASMTKVLTAIVALDSISNLHQKGEVQENDLAGLAEENASVAGIKVGDTVSYEEALYALILPSGADAANFLANHLQQSVSNFVAVMNKKAKALGMNNTNFENTTGLHNEHHYTTLNDMKIMMTYAWKNPVFQKVMTTKHYTLTDLASHPYDLQVQSTLLSYGDGNLSFQGGEIIGGKSGFTLEAGSCLISIAKMEDGHLYMMISAKAEGQPAIDYQHIKDAKKMYEAIANTNHK